MPTYEYRCTECDDTLEVVQRFSDDPLTVCPSCAGRLRKVFSPVGVVFKGSGFYKTDSRSSGKRDGQRVETKNGDGPAKTDVEGAAASASDGAKTGDGKADAAKSDAAKSDGAKGEGTKGDDARSAGGKSDGGRSAGSGSDRPKPGATGSGTSDRATRSAKESVHKVA